MSLLDISRLESPPPTDGLIVHMRGESEQGWCACGLRESPEHFQRFVETKLAPAIEETGRKRRRPA